MKKKMTIDKLAEMTQEGFLNLSKEMDSKFEAVDSKFEAVDGKFEIMDTRLVAVEKKLEDIEGAVHKESLKILQSNDQVVAKLDTLLKEQVADKALHARHSDRLDQLEKKVRV